MKSPEKTKVKKTKPWRLFSEHTERHSFIIDVFFLFHHDEAEASCQVSDVLNVFSVSGCDSGFGQALALRLSGTGVKVFAGVLDVDGAGAQRLRDGCPENLEVLQLDVTDWKQVETVQRYVHSQLRHSGETDHHALFNMLKTTRTKSRTRSRARARTKSRARTRTRHRPRE